MKKIIDYKSSSKVKRPFGRFFIYESFRSSYAPDGYFVGVLPVRYLMQVHYVSVGYIVKYKKTCRSRFIDIDQALILYLLGFPEKITVPMIEQLPFILM